MALFAKVIESDDSSFPVNSWIIIASGGYGGSHLRSTKEKNELVTNAYRQLTIDDGHNLISGQVIKLSSTVKYVLSLE